MATRLTPEQIRKAAVEAGFEYRAVQALINVETGGSGYDKKTGWLLIQFEPSWFKRLLPKHLVTAINQAEAARKQDAEAVAAYRLAHMRYETALRTWHANKNAKDPKPQAPKEPELKLTNEQAALLENWEITQSNGVEGQVRERIAFDAATRIDQKTAQLATSWGLPQMMGFNHVACGFTSVAGMVESFRQSEANQVAAMLRWIRSKPTLASALRKKEWGVVAYHYNGPAYKQFNYDKRLAQAYAALS